MRPFLAPMLMIFAVLLQATSGCAVTKSQNNASGDSTEIPTVSYCKLVENADQFHEKVVRVTGVYERGFEKSYLYDPECRSNQSQMWVSYHKSFVLDGDSEEARKNRMISGFGRWSVKVVGRFVRAKGPGRFGHLGCCRYEIGLVRIEESEKLPEDALIRVFGSGDKFVQHDAQTPDICSMIDWFTRSLFRRHVR